MPAGGVIPPQDRHEVAVVAGVLDEDGADLLEVGGAGDRMGPRPRRIQRREQHGRENRDDVY